MGNYGDKYIDPNPFPTFEYPSGWNANKKHNSNIKKLQDWRDKQLEIIRADTEAKMALLKAAQARNKQ